MTTPPSPFSPEGREPGSAAFQRQLSELYSALSLVGSMPPQPPTPRGRLGAAIAQGVRRLLFWFLPALDRFHASVVRMTESQAEAIEQLDQALGRVLEEFSSRQEAMQRQIAALPTTRGGGPARLLSAEGEQLEAFLEARVEGGRRALVHRLMPIFLASRDTVGAPQGPLLDLFSGRGEWLEIVRAEGLNAQGIEPNSILAAHCRAQGLDVLTGDVLAHLSGLRDGSLSALTSFRAAGHLPFDEMVRVLDAARRVLRPNGILLIGIPESRYDLACVHGATPIPAEVLAYLMEARGLCGIEVRPEGGVTARTPA